MQNLPYESSESSQSSLEAISNLDLHLSDSDQSSDIQTNTSTDVLDGDYFVRNLNILEVSVDIHQEDEGETAEDVPDIESPNDTVPDVITRDADTYQEDKTELAEVNVPDTEFFENSAPQITVTAEDEEYIDEYLENVNDSVMGENFEDVLESVSDQEVEIYVRQFSPDNQMEDPNQEILEDDHDDNKEDDSQLIEHLKQFVYNQISLPKKKDI